jgi:FlaA1/EpsC-like NDP-sugar epimerase
LIYENPSIEKISLALQVLLDSEAAGANGHINGVNTDSAKAESLRVAAMEDVIRKFSLTLSTKRLEHRLFDKTGTLNVLVTGTTGSLGQFLIDALLADTKVRHIYCFNRSPNAEEKFKIRATSIQNYRLEFFHVRLGEPGFGLQSKTLDRLMQDVDKIIHNSWKVSVSRWDSVT